MEESKDLVYNIQHKGRCSKVDVQVAPTQVFFVGDLFVLELKGSVTTNFQGVHKKKNPYMGLVY